MYFLLQKLFLSAIFFAAFDGLPIPIINRLGGIFQYGFFYPLLLGTVLFYFYLYRQQISLIFPREKSLYIFLLFLTYLPISDLVNFKTVVYAVGNGKSGLERMLLPYGVVIFLAILFPYIFFILMKMENVYSRIYQTMKNGFYITVIYSAFQILFIAQIDIGMIIINFFDPYIKGTSKEIFALWRVSGVSFEPSTLSVYLSFIFPWLFGFGCFIKPTLEGKILTVCSLIILIFSTSRTGYFIVLIELLLLLYCFKRDLSLKVDFKGIIFGLIALIGCSFFIKQINEAYPWISLENVYMSFFSEDAFVGNQSNIARFGTQTTAINMFMDNPLFGIGFGQYALRFDEYIPSWAYASREIVGMISGTLRPVAYSLYARILGETGLIGIALWGGMKGTAIYRLLKWRDQSNSKDKKMIDVILVSLLGSILSFHNFDSFLLIGFWIMLILSWVTSRKISHGENLLH